MLRAVADSRAAAPPIDRIHLKSYEIFAPKCVIFASNFLGPDPTSYPSPFQVSGSATGCECDCSTHWRSPASAGWLTWIVDIDRPSFEGYTKQRNRPDLSLGCLGATGQAWSTLITQYVSVIASLSAVTDILQGSIATHMRCGGIFGDSVATNFFPDFDSKKLNIG